MIVVIAFSVGKPFRKPMWTNIPLIVYIILFSCVNYWVIIYPPKAIIKLLENVDIPMEFRLFIVGLSVANLVVSYILEAINLYIHRKREKH
jgi:cation-transporting P-type ATPase 13A2